MPSPSRQGTEGGMFASVAPRKVLARLRRGVAKPQVKLLIGVSDPYRQSRGNHALAERRSSGRACPTNAPAVSWPHAS
jgi:hypothetical protein